jgi:flagellar hook-basal body complex protein FliE
MDEALLAANKMSLEVQFAVKITDKFVTTFREIQQIQV